MGVSEICLDFIFTADLRLNPYNSYLIKFKMRLKEILAEILDINVIIYY